MYKVRFCRNVCNCAKKKDKACNNKHRKRMQIFISNNLQYCLQICSFRHNFFWLLRVICCKKYCIIYIRMKNNNYELWSQTEHLPRAHNQYFVHQHCFNNVSIYNVDKTNITPILLSDHGLNNLSWTDSADYV